MKVSFEITGRQVAPGDRWSFLPLLLLLLPWVVLPSSSQGQIPNVNLASPRSIEVVGTAVDGNGSVAIGIKVTGSPGFSYVIQRSANLIEWTRVDEIALAGASATITDRPPLSSPSYFYRAVEVDELPYEPGAVLVRFKGAPSDRESQEALIAADVSGVLGVLNTELMQLSGEKQVICYRTDRPVLEAVAALQASDAVEHVEPNWRVYPSDESNDPLLTSGRQWGVLTSREFGTQTQEVWNELNVTGSTGVVIGVIDSGIQIGHPDLRDNIWENVADGGFDGDENGIVGDVHGWDFRNNDASVYDGSVDEPETDAHGTHVAGIIGARGGNGIGVAGVNWRVKIIPVKILGAKDGTTEHAIQAIDYLTLLKQKGIANVSAINMSWGNSEYSGLLHNALIRAARAGILCVCSAGNDALDNDTRPLYPASYDTTVRPAIGREGEVQVEEPASFDAIISVTALRPSGALAASFANFGRETVDLAAPGTAIWSTIPVDDYGARNGTSMAAPHVTGALALYISNHGDISAGNLRDLLFSTTIETESLRGITATNGRLNTPRFLAERPPIVNHPPNPTDDRVTTNVGTEKEIFVLANDFDPDGHSLHVSSFSDPLRGQVRRKIGNPKALVYRPDDGFGGTDHFTYTVIDGNGGSGLGSVEVRVQGQANRAPIASDDEVSTDESQPVVVVVLHNDTDLDGDDISVISFADGANGTVERRQGNENELIYTPDPGFAGPDEFGYEISDVGGLRDGAIVRITVKSATIRKVAVSGDLDFGDVEIDKDKSLSVAVTNTGNALVTVNLSVPLGFELDRSSDVIPPEDEKQFEVTFRPAEARLYSGTLQVTGNFTEGGAQSLPVRGTGIEAPSTSIEPTSRTGGNAVSSAGETYNISVTSNTDWSVSEGLAWVSVNPASGSGNGSVTVTVSAHASTQSRSGIITIGGQQHSVEQDGAAPSTSIAPQNRTGANTVAATGESYQIAVTSNTDWSVAESLSWASVNPASGNGNGMVTVTVGSNASIQSRSGAITIGGQQHTVAQNGAAPSTSIAPQNRTGASTVAATGESYQIAVTSNTDWSVSESLSWASVNRASGSGDGSVTITVSANASTQSRSGHYHHRRPAAFGRTRRRRTVDFDCSPESYGRKYRRCYRRIVSDRGDV